MRSSIPKPFPVTTSREYATLPLNTWLSSASFAARLERLAWCNFRAFAGDPSLPHSYCYLGSSPLVWSHVITDSLIGVSYLAISITLAYFVYRGRREIPFHWMFLAFGLFIVGLMHLMEVLPGAQNSS